MIDTTTARDVIELALKEAGVLGVGQTALSEDINDCFTLLQNMIAQWQKRRWLVPSLFTISMPGNNAISNTIGDGQYYNTPRPDKINAAYAVQLNTGSTPVSFPMYPIFSYEDYSLIAIKQLNTLPTRYFYDGAFPFGNVFVYPIPSPMYQINLIIKSQLGFGTTIEAGSITAGGAGYVDGNYVGVPLIGGNGLSATADITVTGGVVAIVTLANGGQAYKTGDVLSAANASLGGSGAGFAWTVNLIESNLDSVMELPPEYFEAMHYNLAVRIISMYQVSNPSPQTGVLAKVALNTIRRANIQVPGLIMPPGLRHGNNFNIYNPDWY